MVGDIVAALKQSGELENTYMIFTSDNGYLLGEHGEIGKHLLFEESIRVPLVIRGPGMPKRVTSDPSRCRTSTWRRRSSTSRAFSAQRLMDGVPVLGAILA